MRLYISGAMSSEPDHGFERFDKARDQLRLVGYDVESPPDIWRKLVGRDDKAIWYPDLCTREEIMWLDIEAVERSHGIALLPTWFSSPGARIEVDLAHTLGKVVAPMEFWMTWCGSLTT